MDTQTKLLLLQMKDSIVDYFTEEIKINSDALKAYENPAPIPEASHEVQRMREVQAMILRDRINELSRHLAVIKRMFPVITP